MELTDAAFVARARAGDSDAYRVLVERHSRSLFRLAYRMTGNESDAEDVVQESFLRAYLSLARLRGPGAWPSYLMQIVRNLCHDTLRRKRVRRTEPIDPEWLEGGPSPEVLLLTEERRRELNAAVAALPELYRVPVMMRFGAGRTRREIAAALGVPESTIIGRIARAMRILRRQLGEEWPE